MYNFSKSEIFAFLDEQIHRLDVFCSDLLSQPEPERYLYDMLCEKIDKYKTIYKILQGVDF